MKNNIILFIILSLFLGCSQDSNQNLSSGNSKKPEKKPIEFYGNTQGTTYAVICNDQIELTHQEIDNTLAGFDLYLSSYIPNSVLSKLNAAPAGQFTYVDSFNYFNRCLSQSLEIFNLTNGAFDPSVYPLVDGWGFMKDVENVPDSTVIASLLSLVGFQNGYHFSYFPSWADSTLEKSTITKNTPQAKLDFNAIAQGLSVDVLCELLDQKGAHNYFVEIGGEIRVKGLNKEGQQWRIGIDKPIEKSTPQNRELQEIIRLDNKAIATSGSYRKFYEKNGVKYSHTLNPKTGHPVTHSLLSATVVASNCALADGLATAFMVMGPEESVNFIKSEKIKGIDVYLIFYNTKGRVETYYTQGFKNLIVSEND